MGSLFADFLPSSMLLAQLRKKFWTMVNRPTTAAALAAHENCQSEKSFMLL
jgi:hypothetical protein